MKATLDRKSSESRRSLRRLGEAERTYKEALDKIASLKAQLSQKDVKVRKETESNDRKINAVESKLKLFVNDTASGIISVAKQIIEGNNKLRTRVNSLKDFKRREYVAIVRLKDRDRNHQAVNKRFQASRICWT